MRLEFDSVAAALPPVISDSVDNFAFQDGNLLDALLKKGVSAAQSGDRDTARKLLSQASAIDPNSEDAWMWLASISEYPEELLAFLDRVLSINPDNSRAIEWRLATCSLLAKNFVQRAVVARDQENEGLAQRCIDQAIDFDSNFAPAWFVRAAMAEEDDQKLEFLDRVLKIDPDHSGAKVCITEISAKRTNAAFEEVKQAAVEGDQAKALEMLNAYLQNVPESVEAWTLKSHLSPAVEQKIEALERALEIAPDNPAARSGLAFLALTFGSSKESVAVESKSREIASLEEAKGTLEPATTLTETSPREDGFAALAEESKDVVEEAQSFALSDTSEGTNDSVAQEFELPEKHASEPEPRSIESMFDRVEVVSAENETVESLSPFQTKVSGDRTVEVVGDDTDKDEQQMPASLNAADATQSATGVPCPFCGSANDLHSLDCSICNARLTLSDIEALLTERDVNRDLLQASVTQMEAEWNLREFNETEMTSLGLGHLNLGNFEAGLRYLQEATRLDANNVILAGQVNVLAIRMDEISRRNEIYEMRLTGKRILVVDDSPTVRKLIAGKLEKSGHLVICASDGIEALEQIEAGLPDLVLLDITMPRMDGYEVCKQIRSHPQAKDLPVVMISGKDGFFDKVRGRMAGSTGYVTKPFGPETLMKALETYLLPEA